MAEVKLISAGSTGDEELETNTLYPFLSIERAYGIEVKRSKLQKFFGLATIETINRSKPVHHTKLQDVSVEYADEFYTWYMDRTKNIQFE